MPQSKYRSIFTSASKTERNTNFENYWIFTQNHGGELLEEEKDLAKKGQGSNIFKIIPSDLENRSKILRLFIVIMLKCKTTLKL